MRVDVWVRVCVDVCMNAHTGIGVHCQERGYVCSACIYADKYW